MTSFDYRSFAEALLPAVVAAGRVQMKHYEAGCAVEHKADSSPVTVADRESEEILVARLAALAPDIPVVAEESVAAGVCPAVGERFFLVDPLDGTREFINRRGEFTINVALVEGGRPVFGAVYAPVLGCLYMTLGSYEAVEAQVAAGAGTPGLADLAPSIIRARVPDPKALVALASRSHQTPETAAFLSRFAIASCVEAGSSLKFCAIARGDADIYPRLGDTCEWDTAAGHAVLVAAGGSVTCLDGTPLTYGEHAPRWLNPHFVAWGRGGPVSPGA